MSDTSNNMGRICQALEKAACNDTVNGDKAFALISNALNIRMEINEAELRLYYPQKKDEVTKGKED